MIGVNLTKHKARRAHEHVVPTSAGVSVTSRHRRLQLRVRSQPAGAQIPTTAGACRSRVGRFIPWAAQHGLGGDTATLQRKPLTQMQSWFLAATVSPCHSTLHQCIVRHRQFHRWTVRRRRRGAPAEARLHSMVGSSSRATDSSINRISRSAQGPSSMLAELGNQRFAETSRDCNDA